MKSVVTCRGRMDDAAARLASAAARPINEIAAAALWLRRMAMAIIKMTAAVEVIHRGNNPAKSAWLIFFISYQFPAVALFAVQQRGLIALSSRRVADRALSKEGTPSSGPAPPIHAGACPGASSVGVRAPKSGPPKPQTRGRA